MTKVKFSLDDDLAILLQAYQDQSGTDRDAIINQGVKQLLVKKLGKKRIAQLLKDSEDGSDYQLEQFFSSDYQLEQFFSSYEWLE
ncbi:hypothetical protein [Lactobacillus delbrueckii]|uniref:hypothetical protein n=1 Tax=Lactobacillus delbrueckii TaxID=1584 RepID=UPI00177FA04F|nr:hypothetical protein [Lactobacillus delbrueckii]MBD5834378.1 hypothetical protein [Lactobacillus delbrueckii]